MGDIIILGKNSLNLNCVTVISKSLILKKILIVILRSRKVEPNIVQPIFSADGNLDLNFSLLEELFLSVVRS